MNVYDFDKTIYNGNSMLDFYFFCFKKKPLILSFLILKNFKFYIYFLLKKKSKTFIKSIFLNFFKEFKDIKKIIFLFWLKNKKKIKPWYLKQKNKSDIVISAGLDVLLKPICKKLNINLISTKIDYKTGKLISKNCYGFEKVKRFKEKFDLNKINKFYSDSYSDLFIAVCAKKSFIVKKNTIIDWKI